MLFIRRFEESLLQLFARNMLSGTTHACMGQEANAVGVMGWLAPECDYVLSNHRCHGHYLAFGGDPKGLLAEIAGKDAGICHGHGGSQHLLHGGFLSNGIQGGGAPIACGLAMSIERKGGEGIVVVCLGDGTMGQGVVYEALNMASLWSLPVLFLVEDNSWAQSTPRDKAVAGSLTMRATAFGVESMETSSLDAREIASFGREAVERVRKDRTPLWAVLRTQRLCAHSKGDDCRSPETMRELKTKDPLPLLGARLTPARMEQAEYTVRQTLAQASQDVFSGGGHGS